MTTPYLGGDADGQTPVDADDAQYLTPEHSTLRTRGELNDAEASGITDALLWLEDQDLTPEGILHQGFLRELHRRMFSDVWTWAGQLRQRGTSIGIPASQIQEQLQVLLGDVLFWAEQETYEPSGISIRFHHRLVFIHPFVNGNGRHARLAAGSLAQALGLTSEHLSWGARSGRPIAEARQQYLTALRAADRGDYQPLLENAVS